MGAAMGCKPGFDKVGHEPGKLIRRAGATVPREFSESHQDRDTTTDGSSGILPLSQPGDVLLDGPADPRGSDPIDGVGADEEAFQHGQPPFWVGPREVIFSGSATLCGHPSGAESAL